MIFLAQDLSTGLDVISGTVIGAVLILVLFGWLWAKPAVDDLRKENVRLNQIIDRKDGELADLRQSIEERVIPAIERNTHLAERVISVLEDRTPIDREILNVLSRLN